MSRSSPRRLSHCAGVLVLLPSLLAMNGAVRAQVGEPRRVEILPPAPVSGSTPPPRGVASDLSARPRQDIQIPAAGPSRSLPRPEDRAPRSPAPLPVYDRSGRLIPGALQVGPGRVLDPRTGRHFEVRKRGDSLQVTPGG